MTVFVPHTVLLRQEVVMGSGLDSCLILKRPQVREVWCFRAFPLLCRYHCWLSANATCSLSLMHEVMRFSTSTWLWINQTSDSCPNLDEVVPDCSLYFILVSLNAYNSVM